MAIPLYTERVIIQVFCFDDQYDNDNKPKVDMSILVLLRAQAKITTSVHHDYS